MQSIICIIRQADATSLWLYIVDQNEFLQDDFPDDLLSIHWPRPSDITDIAKIFTTTIKQHHFTILMEERSITKTFHLLSKHLSHSECCSSHPTWGDWSFGPFSRFLYLDNLVVVYVVQSVGSIPSSNNRGVGQEVGAMDPILKVKLERNFSPKKRVFPLDIVSCVFTLTHMSRMLVYKRNPQQLRTERATNNRAISR